MPPKMSRTTARKSLKYNFKILMKYGEKMIAKTAIIAQDAKVGADCTIGEYCVIEDGVVLEEGVQLGHHVVIHRGTRVGAGTIVGDGTVLGRQPRPAATSTVKAEQELKPLLIGKSCTIGTSVIVYQGTEMLDSCFLGDNSSVRENCQLGEAVLIGQRVVVENNVRIGDYAKVQTGAYITADTELEEHVFIAPMVTTTNDNYMGRTEKRFADRRGPTFKKGCRVGGGVTILPGVTIGDEAFIAAGSIVPRDIPPYQLVMGSPARAVRSVSEDELLFSRGTKQDDQVDKTDKTDKAAISSFDLKRQNAALSGELSPVIEKIVTSGQFILGENVKELEAEISEICGAEYGVGVANGSDALYLALMACGVGAGDEVITTPFTFFATAGSIVRTGAVPVFVDIEPKTYNIDPELIEEKITPRTKAIIPVHLFGQSAEMDRIIEIAYKHGLKVIEDAAQSLGCKYRGRPGGGIGDAGCLSFFPTKNLGCFGDGGMVVTNKPEIAEKLRMLRVHGTRKKYHHELLGINSRLDELQAGILRTKLPHFSGWLQQRQEHAELYNDLFKASGLTMNGNVETPYRLLGCLHTHTYNQYTIAARKRDELRDYLKQHCIGTTVYYPAPLHVQPVFKDLGYQVGDFPHAEQAAKKVLSLPMFPELTDEEIKRVVLTITEFYGDEA
jgi:dTDP-4-amino-4,6-dideoxygalactose transaminase/acetyltransferase-like isoleucine patch superfamily enzyme